MPRPYGCSIFDPDVHLVADPVTDSTPSATMKSLGLEDSPLSSLAFTGPFPFLTEEGVRLHREAVLHPEVLENCMSQTWGHSVQLRGIAPDYSRFLEELWNSDEVSEIVSKAAGVDLQPMMDYEICHVNIQIKPVEECGKSALEQVKEFPVEVEAFPLGIKADDSSAVTVPNEEDMVVSYHKDSYPFVTILLLTPPEGMYGGETVVRNCEGDLKFIKAPSIGQLLVFQGGKIEHAALPAVSVTGERITLVTSWRPKSYTLNRRPLSSDMSHLSNVRGYSNLNELYSQWASTRLEAACAALHYRREEIDDRLQEIRNEQWVEGKLGALATRNVVDLDELRGFVQDLVDYLNHTLDEMVPMGEYAHAPEQERTVSELEHEQEQEGENLEQKVVARL